MDTMVPLLQPRNKTNPNATSTTTTTTTTTTHASITHANATVTMTLRLFLDGMEVGEKDTPLTCGLEDGDELEAIIDDDEEVGRGHGTDNDRLHVRQGKGLGRGQGGSASSTTTTGGTSGGGGGGTVTLAALLLGLGGHVCAAQEGDQGGSIVPGNGSTSASASTTTRGGASGSMGDDDREGVWREDGWKCNGCTAWLPSAVSFYCVVCGQPRSNDVMTSQRGDIGIRPSSSSSSSSSSSLDGLHHERQHPSSTSAWPSKRRRLTSSSSSSSYALSSQQPNDDDFAIAAFNANNTVNPMGEEMMGGVMDNDEDDDDNDGNGKGDEAMMVEQVSESASAPLRSVTMSPTFYRNNLISSRPCVPDNVPLSTLPFPSCLSFYLSRPPPESSSSSQEPRHRMPTVNGVCGHNITTGVGSSSSSSSNSSSRRYRMPTVNGVCGHNITVGGSSSNESAMKMTEAEFATDGDELIRQFNQQHQTMRSQTVQFRQVRSEVQSLQQQRQTTTQPSVRGIAPGVTIRWGTREVGGGESKSSGGLAGVGFAAGGGSIVHRLSSHPSSTNPPSSFSLQHQMPHNSTDNHRIYGARMTSSSSSSSAAGGLTALTGLGLGSSSANAYSSSNSTLTHPSTSNTNNAAGGGGGGGLLSGNSHGNGPTAAVFIPCTFNEGRKPGYLFRKGDFGWGYYLDPKQRPPRPPSVPTLPIATPRPANVTRNTFSVDVFERLLSLPLVSLGTDSFNAMVSCIRREELASARIARQRAMNTYLATVNAPATSSSREAFWDEEEDDDEGGEAHAMVTTYNTATQSIGGWNDATVGGNNNNNNNNNETLAGELNHPGGAGVGTLLAGEPMDVSMGLMAIAGGGGVLNDGVLAGMGDVFEQPQHTLLHPHQSQQQQQEELHQPSFHGAALAPPLLPNVPYHHMPVVCPTPLSESHVLAADLSVSGDTLVSLEGTRALPANHFNPQVGCHYILFTSF